MQAMNKEEIFEILMQANGEDIASVAHQLGESIDHTVIQPPAQELVMFQAEESVEKIDFNVGEILVTTAHIRVGNAIGFSMVMDMNEAKAFDCALLMGVYEAGLTEADKVEKLAKQLHKKQTEQLREEREIISSTRVNFELMSGQDPNVKHNMDSE